MTEEEERKVAALARTVSKAILGVMGVVLALFAIGASGALLNVVAWVLVFYIALSVLAD